MGLKMHHAEKPSDSKGVMTCIAAWVHYLAKVLLRDRTPTKPLCIMHQLHNHHVVAAQKVLESAVSSAYTPAEGAVWQACLPFGSCLAADCA